MHLYYETNKEKYLKQAIFELIHRSNPKKHNGVQNRRLKQSEMLDSTLSPFYAKPDSALLPFKYIIAKLDDTVIPRGTENWPQKSDSDYYIWRTQMDYKVRVSHLRFEGKIFKKGTLPEGVADNMYNCRCWQEDLPENVIVQESMINQNKNYMFANYSYRPKNLEYKTIFLSL